MKALTLLLLFALLPALTGNAKQTAPTFTNGLTPTTEPEPITREPLGLLYFTASWCGPCQLMKSQTWPSSRVKAELENYTFRTIDVDEEPTLAEHWSVRSMPTYIVIDPSGQHELTRTSGFMDADQMTLWLNDLYKAAYTILEEQRAAKIAFQQQWKQLDPLFEETISVEALKHSSEALFTLLARRDGLDADSAADLERALSSLTATYPDRIIHGFLHQDLQVRVKIARALRIDGLSLNPWDSQEQRTQAVENYKNSIQNSNHN